MICAQCGVTTRELSESEYGLLCLRCAFRQAEHDNARDHFGALTPRSLGFLDDDE